MSTITRKGTFNDVYVALIDELFMSGEKSVSRKGKKLTELYDKTFILERPNECMATVRDMSTNYLEKEFAFYMSGSNLLKDAVRCSPFWKKCTDDGVTVNSNYGLLLFYKRNNKNKTQFEHAVDCLKNNMKSKKAVMTIYDNENAYISNDNPCTMFLKARIDDDQKLHLTVVMRSSDIYYGLPYDVPFFVFVQYALIQQLKPLYKDLKLGTYTHIANSLHYYEYKEEELNNALYKGVQVAEWDHARACFEGLVNTYLPVVDSLQKDSFMDIAWKASKSSKCLKKQVGACFTINKDGIETLLTTSFGDIASHRDSCTKCVRDDENDKWYGDDCPSVHSEMRAIMFLRDSHVDYSRVTVYLTHGPCDACCKLMDLVGIKKVVYDVEYKTDRRHWPRIQFRQETSTLRPADEKDKIGDWINEE